MRKFFLWIFVAPFYISLVAAVLATLAFFAFPEDKEAGGLALLLGLPLGIAAFLHVHILPERRRNLEAQREAARIEAETELMKQKALLEAKEQARIRALEEKRLEKEARESEKQRKLAEKKNREIENLEKALKAIQDLEEKAAKVKSKFLAERRPEYLRLKSKIDLEIEVLEDIRSRHPLVGTFLMTRSVTDGDNETQRKLSAIFKT